MPLSTRWDCFKVAATKYNKWIRYKFDVSFAMFYFTMLCFVHFAFPKIFCSFFFRMPPPSSTFAQSVPANLERRNNSLHSSYLPFFHFSLTHSLTHSLTYLLCVFALNATFPLVWIAKRAFCCQWACNHVPNLLKTTFCFLLRNDFYRKLSICLIATVSLSYRTLSTLSRLPFWRFVDGSAIAD